MECEPLEDSTIVLAVTVERESDGVRLTFKSRPSFDHGVPDLLSDTFTRSWALRATPGQYIFRYDPSDQGEDGSVRIKTGAPDGHDPVLMREVTMELGEVLAASGDFLQECFQNVPSDEEVLGKFKDYFQELVDRARETGSLTGLYPGVIPLLLLSQSEASEIAYSLLASGVDSVLVVEIPPRESDFFRHIQSTLETRLEPKLRECEKVIIANEIRATIIAMSRAQPEKSWELLEVTTHLSEVFGLPVPEQSALRWGTTTAIG
jgi:hypothetical protein